MIGTGFTVLAGLVFVPALASGARHPTASGAHRRFVRIGSRAPIPKGASRIGPTAAATMLRIEVLLAPRDARSLAARARSVSTPGSADFRHYLRPGEFAAEYGATGPTIRRVERVLSDQGLRPAGVAANRLSVSFRAPASRVEAAFGLRLPRYQLPHGGVVFANDRAPRLPASLATTVTGVLGLASVQTAAPADLRFGHLHARLAPATRVGVPHAAGPAPQAACASTIAAAGAGLSADELASAYGLDNLYASGDTGAGTTIGLIEFAPLRPTDLSTFANCYGLALPTIDEVAVDGGPGSYDGASQVEAELDAEMLVALAPSASIVVYEGPNNQGNVSNSASYDAESAAITADRAQVLSTSWGGCEASVGQSIARGENVLFEQAALQGQTWVAASGDTGSEDCYGAVHGSAGTQLSVDDPASQPYVTGVGGTTLVVGSSATETVWNTTLSGPDPGAGGGGVSRFFPMPAYQTGAAAHLGVVAPYATCGSSSGRCREVPDVSANAGTPLAIYCTIGSTSFSSSLCDRSGWTGLGGTSAAAPIWAAIFALADASTACRAGGPVGFANPALYSIASSSSYSSAFTDITKGENDLTATNGGRYPASPGYDLASGLGSPIAGNGSDAGLVAALCSATPRLGDSALPLPVVSGIKPRSARARGGARVVVSGSNLLAATTVRFGSRNAAAWRIVSTSRIVAVAPPGTGTVHVTVVNAAGSSVRRRSDIFGYLTRPVVSGITPRTGPRSGGSTVAIRGLWLTKVRSVLFGSVDAPYRVHSKDLLVAVAPRGTGIVNVTVVTMGGTSTEVAADRFRYGA